MEIGAMPNKDLECFPKVYYDEQETCYEDKSLESNCTQIWNMQP